MKQTMDLHHLLDQTLALDLEVTRTGSRVRHMGAVFQGETFEWTGNKNAQKALSDLDAFGSGATYVLGHNIVNHDLPFLQAMAPGLKLLKRSVIDTLFLSPLAFPQNPYHRLVKDYKLVRSSVNDPVEDAKLAVSVFTDQWNAFKILWENAPEQIDFYGFCFQKSRFNGFSGNGMAGVFGQLGANSHMDAGRMVSVFRQLTKGVVCEKAAEGVSKWMDEKSGPAPVAAYALAWLTVAGSNSVLPPWVRKQFPGTVSFLKNLRDIPCGDKTCAYCGKTHDPDAQLKQFFGFDAFREKPKDPQGESLQREIVVTGLKDRPLLAILPTGGGKSLCYQLPALSRHMRRGLLTVVISPLQALMKDQVDNLIKNTGTPFAAAIYGLLTPPERGEALERVRMGDIAILYIAPEQLRSRSVKAVLSQREIGCWVFDEAHCLSKWGHDFRPDYMYAARFIREFAKEQDLPLPPVSCFTATAKPDVIEEVSEYFKTELKQNLDLFTGGIERDNLSFEICPVKTAEKPARTHTLVSRHMEKDPLASAIVYAAKRKTTEQIRDYLLGMGMAAEAFHAGLDPNEKRRIIEAFVNGETPVICATNAFGMGIDKENIRLVLHFDIPGSLENYLQEAGRAGRDLKPATCILLYDPKDAETQFDLGARSEIKKDEIQRILRCLKRSKRNKNNDIVITTQELLRDEDMKAAIEPSDPMGDTKIRTAVSWLERADFLKRNQNLTQVFQGKPLVKNMDQANAVIEKLKLPNAVHGLWLHILRILFNAPKEQGLSADDIAQSLFLSSRTLNRMERQTGLTPGQIVIHALHDMAAAGLLDKGVMLSAYVRPRGKNKATGLLDDLCALETGLLKSLQEEAPDAESGEWMMLDINRLNQRLINDGQKSNPVTLRNLIKGLAYDGKGLAGAFGSIQLQHVSRNRYRMALQRNWAAILETAALRRNTAHLILRVLVEKACVKMPESGKGSASDFLVSFSANELTRAMKQDILLHSQVKKPLAAIDRGLMFLHEHNIIRLQNGLAVFRHAMTIRLNPDAGKRLYTIGDFKPLAMHYTERRFQVHVIMEYAGLAMEKIARALGFVLDYFAMPKDGFVKKYFADRKAVLKRATSVESYRQIVENLNNPVQINIVGSPPGDSQLVLAGPGSGKTKVVVHRCAYLLRVERIPAGRILVMCFNHSASISLRKQLNDLVGQAARGVTVATYHGAAMRLAGISIREIMEHQGAGVPDFDMLIKNAVALLKGEKEAPGLDPDEMRDQLLQGFSHILVDEYQDIDQDQYELVSAIAGKTLEEGEGRLAIMAVGDDDQNVYAFRGANVRFIQQFQKDYQAKTVYLVENYRSTTHIINASNHLIAQNCDRMKGGYPIRINRQRKTEPSGGQWESSDPLSQGRVQRLKVQDAFVQATAVLMEMERLKSLKPSIEWNECAVLARTNQTLSPIRSVFEKAGIPVKRRLETSLPLHRIREVDGFLSHLKAIESKIKTASELAGFLTDSVDTQKANPWIDLLTRLLSDYGEETADAGLPVFYCVDRLYEALAEQRREKTLGQGVFLNTLHGAKGMEFNHVFILDGDWQKGLSGKKLEEERRLFYVGMTRARQTLSLFEMQGNENPLLKDMGDDNIMSRLCPQGDMVNTHALDLKYQVPGLKDYHLGYAGAFGENHPIHKHLADLDVDDALDFVEKGGHIELCDKDGFCVARLSKEGRRIWTDKIDKIAFARILGMIKWRKKDGEKAWQGLSKVESWEVPLVEVGVT